MKKILQIICILIITYVCIYPQWFMIHILQLNDILATPISKKFDRATQAYAFLIDSDEVPKGISGISAKDCAVCHQQIYQEWKQTTHAHALSDLQFQAEIAKKDNPKWLCLNCHIPLKNQRQKVTIALKNNDILRPIFKNNPNFDKKLQQEAITCAVCHLIKDSNNQAAILGPKGSKIAPHPIVKDQKRLQNVCIRCHQPTGESLTPNLLCWFQPFDEAKNNNSKQSCVDCHMPKNIKKISISSLKATSSSAHHWLGSAIPKTYSGYDTLKKRGFIPSIIASSILSSDKITLHIQNKDSGHHLPSGDPERHLALVLNIKYSQNKEQTLVSKIGQTWQWDPAKKIGDNRLKPFEKRSFQTRLQAPIQSYTFEVWNVRLNAQNAHYMKLTTNVDKSFVHNIKTSLKKLDQLYPLATLIFKENYSNKNGLKSISSKELINISKQQKSIPLKKRKYANLNQFSPLTILR